MVDLKIGARDSVVLAMDPRAARDLLEIGDGRHRKSPSVSVGALTYSLLVPEPAEDGMPERARVLVTLNTNDVPFHERGAAIVVLALLGLPASERAQILQRLPHLLCSSCGGPRKKNEDCLRRGLVVHSEPEA